MVTELGFSDHFKKISTFNRLYFDSYYPISIFIFVDNFHVKIVNSTRVPSENATCSQVVGLFYGWAVGGGGGNYHKVKALPNSGLRLSWVCDSCNWHT